MADVLPNRVLHGAQRPYQVEIPEVIEFVEADLCLAVQRPLYPTH
jgi:hypothetical protein